MSEPLQNAAIVYALGFFVVSNLKPGRLRQVLGLPYLPLARLGLWHRWSMYSPDVPQATPLAQVGLRLADDSFVPLPVSGFDDEGGFGKAANLRCISFQFALCFQNTVYLRERICDWALEHWRTADEASQLRPVAVELRRLSYPTPAPGADDGEAGARPAPVVETLWSRSVAGR